MDAKLTPEQAIALLGETRTIENINGYSYKQVELSPEEAMQIALLLESQTREAEMERLAVELANKFVCGISVGDGKLPECNHCHWQEFCRLRAGKEAGK